jgi:hypothetical protein
MHLRCASKVGFGSPSAFRHLGGGGPRSVSQLKQEMASHYAFLVIVDEPTTPGQVAAVRQRPQSSLASPLGMGFLIVSGGQMSSRAKRRIVRRQSS